MRTAIAVVLLAVLSSVTAKSKNRFSRFPSWNSRMYPVWKDGDPRYKDSWKGGEVKFNVGNDSPTLTAAKVTFTIDLEFPSNQKISREGEVVWAQDCTINGTRYAASQPVYPAQNRRRAGVFPDSTPFKKDKRPDFVFVWRTWGQYWQVSDGPSSSLTISTDNVPLGSYNMDIVIYHYRSKDKFIPLGYASTQFSITDQIPFAVSLSQVNDLDAADMSFVRNRAVAFSIALHDPSSYLGNADITFNWDFGDGSGALISRDLQVTHTYVTAGSYLPKVVVQAIIPGSCGNVSVVQVTSLPLSQPSQQGAAAPQGTRDPIHVDPTPSTETEGEEEEAYATSAAQTPSPGNPATETPSPVKPDLHPTSATRPGEDSAQKPVLMVAKRQAGDAPSADNCVIYRYGSFCTGIQVVEGIERVEIVQVNNAVLKTDQSERSVIDLTVTCEGSLPTEVCSVLLDAECLRPVQTECNSVEPSPECQLVLRHFITDSGVFCINVSMTNDVSLAVTSTMVNVRMGSGLPVPGTVAIVLGVLLLALVAGTVAYSYRRLKASRAVKQEAKMEASVSQSEGSVPGMFWRMLGKQAAVDSCPLLQERLA